MLTCQEVVDFLMAYVDGELTADERRLFEEHLAVCPPCVSFLKTYRQTTHLSHAAGRLPTREVDLPPALLQAILNAQRGEAPEQRDTECRG